MSEDNEIENDNKKTLYDDIDIGDLTIDTNSISSVTVADDITIGSSSIYTVLDNYANSITLENLENDNNIIQIGNRVIDAEKIDKLDALLDVIESLDDDNELKVLFQTTLMLKKLKNEY